jgi:hypothetical protein
MLVLAGCKPAPKTESQMLGSSHPADQSTKNEGMAPQDGPFGVAQGANLGNFKDPTPIDGAPGYYKIQQVPQPYPGMEFYTIQATNQHGICMVKAIGSTIASDAFGGSLKSAADKLHDDVEERYGKSKKVDFVMPGSIWNDPQDWMMGLYKGERHYAYLWEKPANADEKIWRHVKAVMVQASAVDNQKGYVLIEYDFDNEAECDKDLKKKAATGL